MNSYKVHSVQMPIVSVMNYSEVYSVITSDHYRSSGLCTITCCVTTNFSETSTVAGGGVAALALRLFKMPVS